MKFIKKNYHLLVIVLIPIVVYVLITRGQYIYGSKIDWPSQHFNFAEYFRLSFYKTKDLLPDFAFNIGGGQNIYNFSYYGFLSPIILISYFLPFVKMMDYVIISSIVSVIVGAILLYKWLVFNNYNKNISFLSTIIYLCASPIIFHTHRHVMFIIYMPFIIMGLFGVDKYFKNRSKSLITISVFLLATSSYYFAIGGILCFILYGLYKYMLIKNKFEFKKIIAFFLPIIIGILMASIVLIPTFVALLNGRGINNIPINLTELLRPDLSLKFILYDHYSLGLTGVAIIALINGTYYKKTRVLSIILISIGIFPIFNYILNGTLYINAKVLIPFIPLYILLIADLIKKIYNKTFNYNKIFIILFIVTFISVVFKHNFIFMTDVFIITIFLLLYRKYDKKIFLYLSLLLVSIITLLILNLYDTLLTKNENNQINDPNYQELINYISLKDNSVYRIANLTNPLINVNKIYNTNYYTTTVYSSLYNIEYNNFYYDIYNNPINYRNRIITNFTNNIMFNEFMGIKYIIAYDRPSLGYVEIKKLGKLKLYQNKNVYPIGYATNNIINNNDFETIKYPYNIELMRKGIVTKEKTNINLQSSNIMKIKDFYKIKNIKNLNMKSEKNYYKITTINGGTMNLTLKQPFKNKILFIRFKMLYSQDCKNGDTSIIINNITNKLTCKDWKYHNQNYTFDYVIAEDNLEDLNISFSKGEYHIKDIETYVLDYKYNLLDSIDNFEIKKMVNDIIEGTINVKNDGYFTISIPYDKGFTITVDDKKTSYEKVNKAMIGFKISKGNHFVKITYNAPYKNIGIICSVIGIISLMVLIIIDKNNKKDITNNLKKKKI